MQNFFRRKKGYCNQSHRGLSESHKHPMNSNCLSDIKELDKDFNCSSQSLGICETTNIMDIGEQEKSESSGVGVPSSREMIVSPLKDNNVHEKGDMFLDNYLGETSPVDLVPKGETPCQAHNELFLVTNRFRQQSQEPFKDVFGLTSNEEDVFLSKSLNNDKLERLLNDLGLRAREAGEDEFELDDKMRTRIYKGRFNKNQSRDNLEVQLGSYLGNHSLSDQENVNAGEAGGLPSKENTGMKRSERTLFNNSRKHKKAAIPTSRPLSNLTNLDLKKTINDTSSKIKKSTKPSEISPRRICIPHHSTNVLPQKPNIKFSDKRHVNIYLVDSLTGQINDATQFGTELNASNCEGFPLPEDVNEVVKIPTNEEPSQSKKRQKSKPKMAIIKAFHNSKHLSSFNCQQENAFNARPGFYNKEEYENYKRLIKKKSSEGVEVVTEDLSSEFANYQQETNLRKNNTSNKKEVRWANNLVW